MAATGPGAFIIAVTFSFSVNCY